MNAVRGIFVVALVLLGPRAAAPQGHPPQFQPVSGGPAAATGSEESIRRARQALGSRWRYPWYDGETDDVRSIVVKPPPQPWNINLSWLPAVFRIVAWTLLVLALVGAALLLVRAYMARENRSAPESLSIDDRKADAARIEALPFALCRDEHDLLGQARRHYERGDFNEAIIYLYSHLLVELDRRQLIRLAKGKTNRQYLREVRSGALAALLEQTMVAFEDVFFGNHPIGRPRFEACWSRLDQFRALAAQGATR